MARSLLEVLCIARRAIVTMHIMFYTGTLLWPQLKSLPLYRIHVHVAYHKYGLELIESLLSKAPGILKVMGSELQRFCNVILGCGALKGGFAQTNTYYEGLFGQVGGYWGPLGLREAQRVHVPV